METALSERPFPAGRYCSRYFRSSTSETLVK